MSEEDWAEMSNVAYIGPVLKGQTTARIARSGHGVASLVRVDTAWALLRFFRTGEDWKTEEVKRQWAEEEYAAFIEREREKLPKPKLVE